MATIRVQRIQDKTVDEIEWEHEELEIVERPHGPAAAAILAAAFGAMVLGLMTVLNEASTGVHEWLAFDDDVGPLSGKTIIAAIGYLAAWILLTPLLWRRNLQLNTVSIVIAVMLAAGFIGTFPKFFELFTVG